MSEAEITLAKINAAMKDKKPAAKQEVKVSCPVDPAERAACEGCQ